MRIKLACSPTHKFRRPESDWPVQTPGARSCEIRGHQPAATAACRQRRDRCIRRSTRRYSNALAILSTRPRALHLSTSSMRSTSYAAPWSATIVGTPGIPGGDSGWRQAVVRYENADCHLTGTTGIWQTVWLEPVLQTYVRRPKGTSAADVAVVQGRSGPGLGTGGPASPAPHRHLARLQGQALDTLTSYAKLRGSQDGGQIKISGKPVSNNRYWTRLPAGVADDGTVG